MFDRTYFDFFKHMSLTGDGTSWYLLALKTPLEAASVIERLQGQFDQIRLYGEGYSIRSSLGQAKVIELIEQSLNLKVEHDFQLVSLSQFNAIGR
ncbi:hypothetical protein KAJ99_08555 [Latilactobacillus sakei]|uniref:hypothetical protein n=1 Tax=Latilactobacillus sakei TaxID=1599 RepID=UPI001F30FEB6|nr:hypothetical protein [Latilactobacillus sakei]MCE8502337.1 hypothetical protein [Latilactobacillus sakei]